MPKQYAYLSLLSDFEKTDWTWEDLEKMDRDPRNFKILRELKAGGMDGLDILDALNTWAFNYRDLGSGIIRAKKGSKIHIKKENRGKFTKSAKAAGEGVQEHAHKVMNDPNATPLQKRRANFAIQAKRWAKKRKNESGGKLNYLLFFNL